MITVVNRKIYRGQGVYIGRPSVLGNPFVIGRDGTRAEVIEKYRRWALRQLKRDGRVRKQVLRLVMHYRETGTLTLVCWCAPEPCHGDVLKAIIERLASA